jgi:hypothetical protein
LSFIRELRQSDASTADRAAADVRKAVATLSRQPLRARPARWPGLRAWSLARWRKIMMCVDGPIVRIVAFYDARQDLSAVDPTTRK